MSVRAMLVGAAISVALALSASKSKQIRAQEPKTTTTTTNAPVSKSIDSRELTAKSVEKLVEQLKRHPVKPMPAPEQFAQHRFCVYMMEVATGEATLIADQPAPNLVRCGSAVWSHDGRRILFDATPGAQFALSRLQSIELGRVDPIIADFGPGNCPSFAPTDDRIAFLSNSTAPQNGVWLMKADGSERRFLGDYGIPTWSPDGRQMMIVSFGDVRQITIMDANPEKSGVLNFPDFRIHSIPSWAGSGTIIAVTGADEANQIALIDVGNPAQPKVKEVLWTKANGPDVNPTYPIRSAANQLCVFIGTDAKGSSLYSIQPGKALPAKLIGKPGDHNSLVNLTFSPDGRYVLYSNHTEN